MLFHVEVVFHVEIKMKTLLWIVFECHPIFLRLEVLSGCKTVSEPRQNLRPSHEVKYLWQGPTIKFRRDKPLSVSKTLRRTEFAVVLLVSNLGSSLKRLNLMKLIGRMLSKILCRHSLIKRRKPVSQVFKNFPSSGRLNARICCSIRTFFSFIDTFGWQRFRRWKVEDL